MKRLVGLIGMLSAADRASSTTERLHRPLLETVSHVDLGRYLGTWYEIASGCRLGSRDGKERVALERARLVDRTTNAELEVSVRTVQGPSTP